MYTAPVLAFGIVALLAYRAFVKFLEHRLHFEAHPSKQALLSSEDGVAREPKDDSTVTQRLMLLVFHYYTPLYLALGWLTLREIRDGYVLLERTNWLDPAMLRAAFDGEQNLPDWWGTELQYMLGDGTPYLRNLSMVAPLFLLMTFGVTVLNILRHVYAVHCKRGGINAHPGHDSAILIIALPLIYSLMAFKSVNRMWMVCANTQTGPLADVVDFDGKHSWLARLVMCQLMYKTNFMVADVYEALALFQFAWLTLEVIGSHRYRRNELTGLGASSQKGIEALTVQGIYLFIFSCLLEAAYYLYTTSVEAWVGAAALTFTMNVQRIKEQVHFFFLGCGTIASSAAISNVVTVEVTFHELLEDFRPSAKFWSTKILVSIAFLQSLLLFVPPLNSMSVTEGNLCYASLLCIECFAVSLLHWTAWNPDESWYGYLFEYLKVRDQQ